jgi:hypothetical protein
MYPAVALVVDPPGHRPRAGAVANLTDVVMAQLRSAEAQNRLCLNPVVDVIIACDAPRSSRVGPGFSGGGGGWAGGSEASGVQLSAGGPA